MVEPDAIFKNGADMIVNEDQMTSYPTSSKLLLNVMSFLYIVTFVLTTAILKIGGQFPKMVYLKPLKDITCIHVSQLFL